jgi:RNA recognition motif-containing protein
MCLALSEVQDPPRYFSMNCKLFVGNLPFRSSAEDIRELFSRSGTVDDVLLIVDKISGRPRGFGFVTMNDSAAADRAIKELDGIDFQGRELKVNNATDRSGESSGDSHAVGNLDGPRQLESRYHRRPALEKIKQYRAASR